MMLQAGILIVGFLFLVKGADWFVEGSASIARKFGIPQLIIGLTIVAMGTSMPEAAVSITAAMQQNAGITIGNVVGSNILNIFTGPPLEMSDDDTVVPNFLKSDGIKVVCGSSTANIVSRYLDKPLKVDSVQVNFIEPPKYSLEGIDLVTEGAVTLNQVYNILDEKPDEYAQNRGGVSTLYSLFQFADRINFTVGKTKNEAHTDVIFRQVGVLPRTSIVPLIAEKLKKEGKLVVINYV